MKREMIDVFGKFESEKEDAVESNVYMYKFLRDEVRGLDWNSNKLHFGP